MVGASRVGGPCASARGPPCPALLPSCQWPRPAPASSSADPRSGPGPRVSAPETFTPQFAMVFYANIIYLTSIIYHQ